MSDRVRQALTAAMIAAERRWSAVPMDWARDPCALACADVLLEVLGVDPAARFRGRFDSLRGFVRALREDGFETLEQAIAASAATHDWPEIAPHRALPGDIGIACAGARQVGVLHRAGAFWLGRSANGSLKAPRSTRSRLPARCRSVRASLPPRSRT